MGIIKIVRSIQLSANSSFWLVENGDAFWVSLFVAPGIENGAKMDVKMHQNGSKGSKMMNKRVFKKCRKKAMKI